MHKRDPGANSNRKKMEYFAVNRRNRERMVTTKKGRKQMKTEIIKTETAINIIRQYQNEQGNTISYRAMEELEGRIYQESIEVDLPEAIEN